MRVDQHDVKTPRFPKFDPSLTPRVRAELGEVVPKHVGEFRSIPAYF